MREENLIKGKKGAILLESVIIFIISSLLLLGASFWSWNKKSQNQQQVTEQMVYCSVFIAFIIALKQFTFTFPGLGRVDFTHIIVIIAGLFYGPWIGGISGFFGDFLGAFFRGFPLFPVIFPFAFLAVGMIAGVIGKYRPQKNKLFWVILFLFVISNYIIEYVAYILFFVYTLKTYTLSQSFWIYYGTRSWKLFWLFPIWLLVISAVYKNIRIKK